MQPSPFLRSVVCDLADCRFTITCVCTDVYRSSHLLRIAATITIVLMQSSMVKLSQTLLQTISIILFLIVCHISRNCVGSKHDVNVRFPSELSTGQYA